MSPSQAEYWAVKLYAPICKHSRIEGRKFSIDAEESESIGLCTLAVCLDRLKDDDANPLPLVKTAISRDIRDHAIREARAKLQTDKVFRDRETGPRNNLKIVGREGFLHPVSIMKVNEEQTNVS